MNKKFRSREPDPLSSGPATKQIHNNNNNDESSRWMQSSNVNMKAIAYSMTLDKGALRNQYSASGGRIECRYSVWFALLFISGRRLPFPPLDLHSSDFFTIFIFSQRSGRSCDFVDDYSDFRRCYYASSSECLFLADRTITVAFMLQCCVSLSVVCNVCIMAKRRVLPKICLKKQIRNDLQGIEWSRDRWRHVIQYV